LGRLTPALLFCCFTVLAAPSVAAERPARAILLLCESALGVVGPGYAEAIRAFRATLRDAWPARVYVENLDLKYFRGPAYEASVKHYLETKYRDVPIAVLVTFGPSALEFGIGLRSEHWPDVPVVVAASDDLTVARAVPDASETKVTGRTLLLSLTKSVAVARMLVPDLKQIVLVGDALQKQRIRHRFIEELPEVAKSLSLIDLTGRTLDEVKDRVATLPRDSVIIYTAATADSAGRDVLSYEMSELVAAASNQPMVVDIDNRLGHGGTGGFLIQNDLIGKEAAQLVLRILNGEDASQIPIAVSDAVRLTFDWRELQRLGIADAALPPGSTVLFREPSAWEQYRWRIVLALAAFVLQAGLIAGLLYEDRRRKAAEDNAHGLATQLELSNRFATAGELTASIAHEVRQPLTSIVVAAETGLNWLGNKIPDLDEVRSSLRHIIDEGHRVDDVVRNMVAMFRHQTPERVPISINSLIDDVLMLAGRKIQANGISLQTEYAGQSMVLGNPVQLQQVLMNLVVNAIEAMSQQKGRDAVLQIVTQAVDPPGQASIIVRDSGPGIATEHLDRIFKPFFSTKSGGMGLGLAICKSIVEAHGGKLTVASGDQSGTTFTVVLPLEKGTAHE